ncbi:MULTISPECIES: CBASS cGAMP-activated phospholipase [Methylobacterium]|jgi:patatin-like phospholipase/acyl hydrolase|uniref:CBASS cGAMP-activated phospholipase n=1 Tax=Methylobacterium TaxID=407 RepID=UPI0006FCB1FB|nr:MULTISPECIES: CBASS cGAMP-activated phospholipase [unclassified Methylobacterium]KQO66496.1 patatin [Methylobacterium sp. Leaf89]
MTYVPPRRSDDTHQGRRIRQPWPADRPFRILSIDGGGICGILPASVLAELEHRFLGGRSIAGHFDMIAGTSTGGIIALGLAHGRTAGDVRDIYVERGSNIFPPPTRVGRIVRSLRRTHRYAYDRAPLEEELLRIFGDAPFGDARTRLCIPSFEGRHGEPWIFKTPHHPDYRKDRFERMVKVGLSTAAAPTYFEALPNNGYVMVDGGLWANNPVMNALVDALACYDVGRGQIEILSLGCGETAFTVDQAKARGGLFQWKGVILAAMRAQSHNALGQAGLLVGKDRVMRIDAPESSNAIALDDHRRATAELPAMARSLVEASGREIARVFLGDEAAPYTPCPLPL